MLKLINIKYTFVLLLEFSYYVTFYKAFRYISPIGGGGSPPKIFLKTRASNDIYGDMHTDR